MGLVYNILKRRGFSHYTSVSQQSPLQALPEEEEASLVSSQHQLSSQSVNILKSLGYHVRKTSNIRPTSSRSQYN